MKSTCSTRGGALILTVLLVAAIGILFGFGRLLAFRYQCEQRFDRQRELEKVMATRSVLNYILRSTGNTLPPSNIFTYRPSTNGSVISVTNVSQGPRFDMQFTGTTYSAAISFHDSPIETLMMNTNYPVTSTNNSVGLEIGKDSDAIANLIAGVSMVVTNNWLDPCEVYGLRYFMHIGEVNYYDKSESASGDVQRIYIEPVNRPDVRIMLEQIPDASSECTLRAVVWSNSVPCFTVYSDLNHNGGSRLQLKSAKGLQLCGDIMTIVDNEGTRGIRFWSDSVRIPSWVADAFLGDLRLRIECQMMSTPNPEWVGASMFSGVSIKPAYTYEIYLGWYSGKTHSYTSELATVAHAYKPSFGRADVITYETHGTAAK